MVPPRGLGALHISTHPLFISHRPDGKGTLASDLKGAGARAPMIPPPVHTTDYDYTKIKVDPFQFQIIPYSYLYVQN